LNWLGELRLLIFGNEKLCIERERSALRSYPSNALGSHLHYDPPKGDNHFLIAVEDREMV
jgi:hypothetical protein